MWEKTVRYPGHVEKIRLLKDLGFFDEESVEVEKLRVSPRKVTIKLLEKKLLKPKIKDLLAMKVKITGVRKNSKRVYAFYLLDHYDEKHGVTAMARTTAYTASIMAQLLIQRIVKGKGVIPPESVAAEDKTFNKILTELKKRQIKIEPLEDA
jgi:lysine 6-dehydrogenase